MAKIAIVTDSTAYLLPEMRARYGVQVLPLKIHWGEEAYLDGVEMTPAAFYTRLASDPVLPTTSQPSIHDFLETFENLATQYEGIVAPLISSGISGTVASAESAAEQTTADVEVIDTRVTSAGQALVVLAAARAAEQGAGLREVARIACEAADRMKIYFALDTLEFLHKGGRIGGAARYMGTMLSIKPLLTFDPAGKITAYERVRTRRKALERLAALVEEQSGGKPVHVGVLHANTPEDVAELAAVIARRVPCVEMHTFEISPVIGIHVGPGAIGVAFYPEE